MNIAYVRSARWSLPSGLAAIGARMPLGPLVLVDTRLTRDEVRAAAVIAITRLRAGASVALVAYADVWEAARLLEELCG